MLETAIYLLKVAGILVSMYVVVQLLNWVSCLLAKKLEKYVFGYQYYVAYYFHDEHSFGYGGTVIDADRSIQSSIKSVEKHIAKEAGLDDVVIINWKRL